MDEALAAMLSAREARWQRRMELSARYPALVSCTLCVPLPFRTSPEGKAILQDQAARLAAALSAEGFAPGEAETLDGADGTVIFLPCQGDAKEIKRSCVRREESAPAGRILDIDVTAQGGVPIGRAELALPPRRCFLCGRPAAACVAETRHSPQAVAAYVTKLFASEKKGETMKSYRISAEGLEKICAAVFAADGMDPGNAEKVAASLVEADLRGVSSHGTVRLKSYVERSHKEHWNPNPHFTYTQTLPAVALLDGDAGFGSLVGTAAMEKAMELAETFGVGICAAKNSSHFGMGAYYPLLAARRDMFGFCCTNGMPNLAPFGGREGMLGTNPFSLAMPVADGEPLVLDVACSVTARGNVSNYKREGREIPAGWCIDKDGNPTRDPEVALKGCMLPFGGHKGSGLAVFVDILSGILSGAAYGIHLRDGQKEGHEGGPGVGHFFLAAKLSAFGDPEALKARAAAALNELRASAPAPGFEQVLMPGDIEAKKRRYNLEHGILMGEGSWREICQTCARYVPGLDPGVYVMSETEEEFLKK